MTRSRASTSTSVQARAATSIMNDNTKHRRRSVSVPRQISGSMNVSEQQFRHHVDAVHGSIQVSIASGGRKKYEELIYSESKQDVSRKATERIKPPSTIKHSTASSSASSRPSRSSRSGSRRRLI
mmetsp:Transcript_42042/g.47785  ORF Transcript_42042/g.47785 Transcript_42042/m.47785 type:complete len:125 (+) Transcript_42042:2-376(+)